MSKWIDRFWQYVRRVWRISPVKGIAWGVLAFLFTELVASIIQDTFPGWMRNALIPWLIRSTDILNWVLLLSVVVFVFSLVITQRLSKAESWLDPKDIRTLKYAAEYLHYKSFLDLLTGIDNELRRLVYNENRLGEFDLRDFIDIFFIRTFGFLGPDVRTGVIFRPSDDDPEWLVGWKASPGHYLTEKKFYIGEKQEHIKDRGSAGEAFIRNIPQKYNLLDPFTGEADDPYKKKFPEYEKKRGGAGYLSSINLPIRWGVQVVGVLAIDSNKRNFFTDEDISMLQIIADRIGDALYLRRL